MIDSNIATHRSEVAYARHDRRYSTKGGALTSARRAYSRAVRHDERATVARLVADHVAALAQDAREEVHARRHAAWAERMAEAQADLEEIREVHLAARHLFLSALDSGAPNDHLDVLGERLDELSVDLDELLRELDWLDINEPQL